MRCSPKPNAAATACGRAFQSRIDILISSGDHLTPCSVFFDLFFVLTVIACGRAAYDGGPVRSTLTCSPFQAVWHTAGGHRRQD